MKLRRALVLLSLLWLPLLLVELIAPYPWPHLLASPVLIRVVSLAASVAALSAGVLAVGSAFLAGHLRAAPRGSLRAPEPEQALALAASALVLVLREPVHGLAAASGVAPELGFLGLLLGALALAAAAARLCERLVPEHGPWLVAGAGGLAWWGLVGVRLEPGRAVWAVFGAALFASCLALRGPRERPRRWAAALVAIGVLLPAAAVVASGVRATRVAGPRAAVEPGRRDNVILVNVDTLRADHTSLHAAGAAATPRLAEQASAYATYFAETSTAATFTKPSVRALFTARDPIGPVAQDSGRSLAASFQQAGYRTAAFVANGLIDAPGYGQGFDTFVNVGAYRWGQESFLLLRLLYGSDTWSALRRRESLRLHKEEAPVLVALARRWIESHRDGPFFVYLHLMDPHWPFHARGFGPVPEATRSFVDFMRVEPDASRARALRGTPGLAALIARYREEIRHADRALGELFDALDALGLDPTTLVIVTGDHGEEFFEHVGFGHGHDVFEEQAHVPLLFRWPQRSEFEAMPRRVDAPASLQDVYPTLAELLEVPGPDAPHRGRSLLPLLEGGSLPPRPILIFSRERNGVRPTAWREGALKLRFAGGPQPEAYDLARDPAEVSPGQPQASVARRARALVTEAEPAVGGRSTAGDGAEEGALERLRGLGYVE